MGFLFSSKNNKTIAIFDIGSGSIGGAIVKIGSSSNPVILTSVREDIILKNEVDQSSLISQMIKTLHKTASNLLYMKMAPVDEIFCVLSSPWYLSENKIINFTKKNKKFIFTKKIANKILQEEISGIVKSHNDRYNIIDNDYDSSDVIEQHVLSVKLDGKDELSPIGKTCKEILFELIVSFSPKSCILGIKNSLGLIFHDKKVSFLSFTSATHLVLRDKLLKNNSYIIIDVAGEVTDISIISDGILSQMVSLPFGRNKLFREISNKLNIDLREAKEIFKLYSRDNIFDGQKSKISPVVYSVISKLKEDFNKVILEIPNINKNIPKNIFITADDDIKNFMYTIFSKDCYISNNNHKFNVEKIEANELLYLCDFVSGYHDPFLMIEAIAINKKLFS